MLKVFLFSCLSINKMRFLTAFQYVFFSYCLFVSMCIKAWPGSTNVQHQSPENSDEVKEQLARKGYSAGEDYFNSIVFNVDAGDIEFLNNVLDSEPVMEVQKEIHLGQRSFHVTMYLSDGEITCSSSDLQQGLKPLLGKMVKKLSTYIDDAIVKYELMLYKDESLLPMTIGFHRDSWPGSGKDPDYLAFAVLSLAEDNSSTVISNIKLGYIHVSCKQDYTSDDVSYNCDSFPSANGPFKCYHAIRKLKKGKVEHVVDLKNSTNTGYIINQKFIVNKEKLIVHGRYESRVVAANSFSRLSMIIRCYRDEDKHKTNNRSSKNLDNLKCSIL
ncbi:MAG: hypothetical protein QS748_13815 [Candidatus Endonucleobacter bathymodioli]|uniref:Uncharacterized protein n=1 Tax=Candidatus Endonucleibacter bathymodioli TaxID=539814 RepID=A0AA90NWD1_9GAMM|nr:hypothetical protein [Candidatus Endonucleobacter bathymodioli]